MSKTQLFDLDGKIAFVSGASRGIGEAIAKLLAQQGAHVIVSSRKIDGCQHVADAIIADGGIRSHGDIAKSIRFGASMVMIGSLFAGHEESPGKTVEVDGEMFKEYYGSASDFNKGEYKHVEGKRILEPIKGKLANTLIEMEQDVQSSISYSGGTKLMDIRKVNYVTLGGDNAGEHLLM